MIRRFVQAKWWLLFQSSAIIGQRLGNIVRIAVCCCCQNLKLATLRALRSAYVVLDSTLDFYCQWPNLANFLFDITARAWGTREVAKGMVLTKARARGKAMGRSGTAILALLPVCHGIATAIRVGNRASRALQPTTNLPNRSLH